MFLIYNFKLFIYFVHYCYMFGEASVYSLVRTMPKEAFILAVFVEACCLAVDL